MTEIAVTGTAPRPNTDAELAAVRRMVERRIPEGAERVQVLDMLLGTPTGMRCRTCARPMRWPSEPKARNTGRVIAATKTECAQCARQRKARS